MMLTAMMGMLGSSTHSNRGRRTENDYSSKLPGGFKDWGFVKETGESLEDYRERVKPKPGEPSIEPHNKFTEVIYITSRSPEVAKEQFLRLARKNKWKLKNI